ncbi:acyltransferase family protein [Ramlibacter alkalitolerans]|uniref:Acyltransferase n=1 Tax=Ramlibacter alkalitolerans TaxID=2039631 RepID=A0ABS1JNF4_9BURK|nr:acyltransferase [Ramlibacter alkalitolerans]MBL0425789.1 acyltransferase [Ramlibacter alkalitolerans]
MLLTTARSGGDDASRLASLDMLRALAVFLVIGHHAAWRFRPAAGDVVGQLLKGSGWIGVDIFFGISGFMITSILWRDAEHIKAFFVRRIYRIVPIFLVAIASFVLVTIATGIGADRLFLLWSPALFLNGWTIPIFGASTVPFTITWSLSVEETAYLVLGLSCLGGRRALRAGLFAMLVGAPLLRIAVATGGWFDPENLYYFVPARLDSIALGGLAAISTIGQQHRRWQVPVAGCAVFALIWMFQFVRISDQRLYLVGYTVFGIATAALVSGLAAADVARARSRVGGARRGAVQSALAPIAQGVATFGKYSYFIYLFHLFVLEAILQLQHLVGVRLGYWQALPLACAIVFTLAAVSWKYFEYPLIRKGRERTSQATQAAIHPSAQAPT